MCAGVEFLFKSMDAEAIVGTLANLLNNKDFDRAMMIDWTDCICSINDGCAANLKALETVQRLETDVSDHLALSVERASVSSCF